MAQMAQMAQTEYLNEEIQRIATEPEAKHDLTSPRFFADPHAVFRRMRAGDPVYWHPTLKTWFLVRYTDVQRILRDGLLALFEHPDQLQKLRADPELAAGAVEEFLRYNSAVFQLVRRAREQVEIDGHVIHEGDLVIGLLHAANRDPARFADADRLDISREDNYHVGFGYGPHICVGAPIARMETRIAINTMLQRLPEIALASTSLEWSTNFAIRGVRALPVTFRS